MVVIRLVEEDVLAVSALRVRQGSERVCCRLSCGAASVPSRASLHDGHLVGLSGLRRARRAPELQVRPADAAAGSRGRLACVRGAMVGRAREAHSCPVYLLSREVLQRAILADAVLLAEGAPELAADLVAALAYLQADDLARHPGCRRSTDRLKSQVDPVFAPTFTAVC